jgi:hypothetical protein
MRRRLACCRCARVIVSRMCSHQLPIRCITTFRLIRIKAVGAAALTFRCCYARMLCSLLCSHCADNRAHVQVGL